MSKDIDKFKKARSDLMLLYLIELKKYYGTGFAVHLERLNDIREQLKELSFSIWIHEEHDDFGE